ncbi:ANTH domain-containing protein [Earliella scabrosa]|nr:ANTH domain-containing protein [Earliella scabrosa]
MLSRRQTDYNIDGDGVRYPTRAVGKDKAEAELVVNIKKATSPDETAPKQKHVREAHGQTGWLETCARTVGQETARGYGPLIRTYVRVLLPKLPFPRLRPELNALFEYEEYITLKGIDDPDEGYETISDLMGLEDHIDSFQRMIVGHLRSSANNDRRISALVPLVKESCGIYRFITSMLRAMHRRTSDIETVKPLRSRYSQQHYALRKFYYECSNLKHLTGLINVPKIGQSTPEPPNLLHNGSAPDLPARPRSTTVSTSPPATPQPTAAEINEQARMLKQYEEQQAAPVAAREAKEEQRKAMEELQRREFEQRHAEQAERERLADEQPRQQQMQQQMMQYGNQASQQVHDLEHEVLAMPGQYERDQLMSEQYDRRLKALECELAGVSTNVNSQMMSKDELIPQLQEHVVIQLRTEHLNMLAKFKQMQLNANSAQEVIDKTERMERDLKGKNLHLLRREISFANERAEHGARSKSSDVSRVLSKYNRQLTEVEHSLRPKQIHIDDLLSKLDHASGDMEHLLEEKDQEITILQEFMHAPIQQLSETQQNRGLNQKATKTQIDAQILHNRKNLKQIIGRSCVRLPSYSVLTYSTLNTSGQKVDDAIYELESPTQARNLNSTPEELTRLVEEVSHKLINVTKNATKNGLRTFFNLQSYKLDLIPSSPRSSTASCPTVPTPARPRPTETRATTYRMHRLLAHLELLDISSFPLHSRLQQRQPLHNLDRVKSTPNSALLAIDTAPRDHQVHGHPDIQKKPEDASAPTAMVAPAPSNAGVDDDTHDADLFNEPPSTTVPVHNCDRYYVANTPTALQGGTDVVTRPTVPKLSVLCNGQTLQPLQRGRNASHPTRPRALSKTSPPTTASARRVKLDPKVRSNVFHTPPLLLTPPDATHASTVQTRTDRNHAGLRLSHLPCARRGLTNCTGGRQCENCRLAALHCFYERPCPYDSVGRNPTRSSPTPSYVPAPNARRHTAGKSREVSTRHMRTTNTHKRIVTSPCLFSILLTTPPLRTARFSPDRIPANTYQTTLGISQQPVIHAPSPQLPSTLLSLAEAFDNLLSTYPPSTNEEFWGQYDTPKIVPRTLHNHTGPKGPNTMCATCGASSKRLLLISLWCHGYDVFERNSESPESSLSPQSIAAQGTL